MCHVFEYSVWAEPPRWKLPQTVHLENEKNAGGWKHGRKKTRKKKIAKNEAFVQIVSS